MESAASPEPRSKLLHGKSPLSQSWHAEDNDTNTTEKATKKRSTSTTEEETPAAKAASSTEEPKKKKTSGEDKETKVVNPFAALDSTPIEVSSLQTITAPSKSRSTSADVFGKPAAVETEQTMVNSSITGPETIAKRTRYTELPLEAQAEIDNLWQLISQQTSTCRTIQAKQLASNGEMIEDISRYTKRMALDVRLTKEQHQSTLKNVIRLRDNVEHELTNALVVKVYHETDDSRKWMTGQTATRQYFVDLINGMQARCIKYRDAIKEIEDHMKHIDKDYANLTPGCIPRILREQHQVLLSLAAKVSNLHDETQKLVNNSKGGNV
ncbi:hypothetical protein BX666DRAFT_1606339 [Dichotomocladium elegans]|nr:hypothetical protein BX666DRAFT_1606339 [Dichotomocladium elegans]